MEFKEYTPEEKAEIMKTWRFRLSMAFYVFLVLAFVLLIVFATFP